MKLINNTKTKFTTSEGEFKVNEIKDFSEENVKTLLRYPGINKIEDLEEKKPSKSEIELMKEEAVSLGLEFAGNISKAKLAALIAESKEDKE